MADSHKPRPDATPETGPSGAQRVLAFMFAAVCGVSILALLSLIVAGAIRADITTGIWPFVLVLPIPGFAVAFALMFALLILTAVRRSRAAKEARS